MRSLLRLLRAWITGRYRVVPWRTLLVLALVLLYAVSPVDLIPDVIPVFGVVDDAAMFGLLLRSLMADARRFRAWEDSGAAEEIHS